MNRLKVVFWDLDGTIADTELNGHRRAYNFAFKDFSLRWNWNKTLYSDLLSIGGGKNRIKYYSNKVGKELSEEKINDIYKKKNIHYRKLIEKGTIFPRTGVIRLINELYGKNVKQWVVTTSGRDSVIPLISKYFDDEKNPFSGYICGEDVCKHKPNPEAYELALIKSNCKSQNVVVIEDSLIGLEAAVAANLKCIITISPWKIKLYHEYERASLVLDHLGDNEINSKCLYGHLKENMVNYNCLLSVLN